MKLKLTLAITSLALASGMAQAQTQGVSANEIVLGSIQDLSGPIAGFGKQARLGMLLAVDEINEQGGINGRKVKLLVEDSAYDPKKANLAAQKLVNQDKIFMMLGHIGTAQNLAAMPVQFEKNVINFFPITAAREMYEPFHKLKYSYAATYYDQMRQAVPKWPTMAKILSWLTSFCAASTAFLGSYLLSSTSSLSLRPLTPPCSLISSTRSVMPRRICLPKPASGPDRSWMEPRVISSLLTPCDWASAAPVVRASAAAVREIRAFIGLVSLVDGMAGEAWCSGPALSGTWPRSAVRTSAAPACV